MQFQGKAQFQGNMQFLGKNVLISEAESALGRELAAFYAREGANLTLVIGDAEAYALPVSREALWLRGRLGSYAACEHALEQLRARFGALDILILNDDQPERGSIEDAAPAFIQSQLDANAKVAFCAVRVLGAHMAARGSGRILVVSSTHAEKPTGCAFAYAMAKSAVSLLVKEAAIFLGKDGVTVNEILAGAMEGDERRFESEISGFHYTQHTKLPRKRSGHPRELVPACALLTSSGADFIMGASLRVDGGHELYYVDR